MSYPIRNLALLSAVGALAAIPTQHADAGFVLELENGGTTVTIPDGSILDNNPAPGSIEFLGPVGVFDVNVTTGISKPITGSATDPNLNLNSVNVSSNSGGTLVIRLTDTGFTAPVGPATDTLLTFGGTTNGTAAIDAYLDTTDTEFGTGIGVSSLGPFGPAPVIPFGASDASTVSLTGPYSATLEATVVHNAASDVTSFGAQFRVPEPGSLALFAIGAGLIANRRRRA